MTKGDIYTIAGNGTESYSGDGAAATSAELNQPEGVTADGVGNLLIADTGNSVVRLVAGSSCATNCPYGLSAMTKGDIYTIAGNGTESYSGDGGAATSAELNQPSGVAVDGSGDLLIADEVNERVRLVATASCSSGCPYGLASMTEGDIYTIAGNGSIGPPSGDGGPATSAELFNPDAVGVDSEGDLLIATGLQVRLVAAASCSSSCPYGLSSMTEGDIYTVAGNGSFGFSGDGGPATSAELYVPSGVAVDSSGDLLIADPGNSRVRLVAAASCSSGCPYGLSAMTKGDIYTIAGNGTQGFSGDGSAATSAELEGPSGVAVDGVGDLLIADGSRVRLVAGSSCTTGCPYGLSAMTKGDIYTIAGNGTHGFSGDGSAATSAELSSLGGVAVDGDGNLLIADYGNNRVRLVTGRPTEATYQLQVSLSGSGSGSVSGGAISCPGTCSVSVSQGSQVTLNATPATGSTFAGWSGGGCSGTGSCTVTMNSDQQVIATFSTNAPPQEALQVSLSGSGSVSGGGITCPGTCSVSVTQGSQVTLNATPAAGRRSRAGRAPGAPAQGRALPR